MTDPKEKEIIYTSELHGTIDKDFSSGLTAFEPIQRSWNIEDTSVLDIEGKMNIKNE
jgi:hypothetical protein